MLVFNTSVTRVSPMTVFLYFILFLFGKFMKVSDFDDVEYQGAHPD